MADGSGIAAYDTVRPDIAALMARGGHGQALRILDELAALVPMGAALADDIATCCWKLGDHARAMQAMGALLERAPRDAAQWARLGAMAFSCGELVLAEQALTAALEIRPAFPAALLALGRIRPFAPGSPHIRQLRSLAHASGAAALDRSHAHTALALTEAQAGRPAAAMRHFGRAKQLMPGSYDAAAVQQRVAAQRRRFVPRPAPDDTRIVFVVGLPRSGTTLMESILLRHGAVASLGESHALQETLARHRQQVTRLHGPGDDWSWLDHLDPAQLPGLRQTYLQIASRGMELDPAAMLLDKTPLNLFDLGFAHAIFPQARFIFMSRHPMDLGLSNFTTSFTAGFTRAQPFSKRLDTIGHFIRCADDSARDYRDKLGPLFRSQSYAALVRMPETQIRQILDHLGLDWQEACLTPEMRSGAVRTASTLQVRAPIHAGALEKWRPYERELQPLRDALGQDWLDDWQRRDQLV